MPLLIQFSGPLAKIAIRGGILAYRGTAGWVDDLVAEAVAESGAEVAEEAVEVAAEAAGRATAAQWGLERQRESWRKKPRLRAGVSEQGRSVARGDSPHSPQQIRDRRSSSPKSANGASNGQTRGRAAPGRRVRSAWFLAPADQITECEPDRAGNQHCGEGLLRGVLADVLS